jgi:hypothetical protein
MRRAFLTVAAGVLFIGCGGASVRYASLETGDADFQRVWRTTVDVLAGEFPNVETDRDAGTITTGYLVERPGVSLGAFPAAVAHPDRASEQFTAYRRRATARIVKRDDLYSVLLKVEKEREDVGAPAPDTFDDYGPMDGTRTRIYGPPDRDIAPVWTPAGSDDALRDRLLERIRSRLLEAS